MIKALLLMGCPELPVQTAAALYIANKLNREGFEVIAAGNRAALGLLLNSDPERHYIKKAIDIDRCIADLAEKKNDYDICFAPENVNGFLDIMPLRVRIQKK